MTKLKWAGPVLRAVMAIGIASGGIAAATAQTNNSMAGMKMGPDSKMDMQDKKMPANKSANHKHVAHHKHAMHKKSATK